MTEEKIKKVFSNEKFVKRLLEQKSPQDVQELLEEKDIFLSLDELLKIKKLIDIKLECTDEELAEDDLFAIAGGCDPLTCIVLPVLLAVTAIGGAAIFEFTEIKW